jgi:hypothetical protein
MRATEEGAGSEAWREEGTFRRALGSIPFSADRRPQKREALNPAPSTTHKMHKKTSGLLISCGVPLTEGFFESCTEALGVESALTERQVIHA